MGAKNSKIDITHNPHNQDKCNYNCPTCKSTGKLPNLEGKFFIINSNECQCNSCYTIYDKSIIYKRFQIGM